jgi:hypothetical protein
MLRAKIFAILTSREDVIERGIVRLLVVVAVRIHQNARRRKEEGAAKSFQAVFQRQGRIEALRGEPRLHNSTIQHKTSSRLHEAREEDTQSRGRQRVIGWNAQHAFNARNTLTRPASPIFL